MTTTLENSPGKSNIYQHSENVCSNHIIIDKKFESLQKIFEIGSMKEAPTTVMNISAKFVSDNWKVRLRRSKTWRSFTTRSSSKLILIYNQTLCINRLCSLQKDFNYHRLNKNVLLKGVILRLLFKMKWRRCALLSMVQNLKKLSKEYDLLLPTIHCLINWHLQYIGTFTCFTWTRKSKCFTPGRYISRIFLAGQYIHWTHKGTMVGNEQVNFVPPDALKMHALAGPVCS